MRVSFRTSLVCIAAALTMAAGVAHAEQVTVVGPVTSIVMGKDDKSADATLKDNKGGASVVIHITDDLTLDKFKDKRIQIGDEIRSRYDKADHNLSKSFKKTAGC